jgi:hypothetical protein
MKKALAYPVFIGWGLVSAIAFGDFARDLAREESVLDYLTSATVLFSGFSYGVAILLGLLCARKKSYGFLRFVAIATGLWAIYATLIRGRHVAFDSFAAYCVVLLLLSVVTLIWRLLDQDQSAKTR